MKRKNIFISLCLTLSMLWGLTACSSEDSMSDSQTVKTVNGFYVQKVNFICEAPGYDQGTTRAVTYNWKNYTSLFARFKSGSNYYIGYISIEPDGWNMISTTEFINMTTSGTCELYYLLESNGDNYYMNLDTGKLDVYNNGSFVKSTDIAWNASSINLTEGTAVYATTTATYSTENGNGWTIQAMLNPMMWRMRFSGSNGTSITLPRNDNDIKYVSAFNWSTSAVSFTKATKDVTLKVNGSYTPYIYGEFIYSYAKNTITVVNGSNTFYREFSSSNLPAGKSGYFTIPTTSNYSNNGWTMKQDVDPNATIAPNLLVPFEEGWASNWTVGSTAAKVLVITFSETGYTGKSDEELINAMEEKYDPEEISQYENKVRCGYNNSSSFYSPNKQYYLCTVAYNSSGQRGPLIKTPFKTRAANLPYAEITDLRRTSEAQWKWKVSLKNTAKSYYWNAWNGSDRFSSHAYCLAWLVYRDAINGKISAESEEGEWKWDINDTYMTVCTWGVASDGSFGNYRCSSAASSVYAPYQISTYEPKISNVKNNNMTCCPVSNVVLEETMDKINIIKIEE